LRDFGFALLVPSTEGALRVGVDHESWPVAGLLGLDSQVGAQRRLAASAFLRVDNDGLHDFMLLCF
jgi:hypothetical protein